jgi:hypothetical protein
MPVMHDKVAALSALLPGPDSSYTTAFLAAAFVEAVNRRFGKGATEADVIEYVADVRRRSDEIGDAIDPGAAVKLILAVLSDESARDVDARTRGKVFVIFIAALISDERLDGDGIDAVLASARMLADEWLAQ